MRSIPFPERNRVLGIPAELYGRVQSTEAFVEGEGVQQVCITKWTTSFWDRLRFLLRGEIWVSVYGGGCPPMHLNTRKPLSTVPDAPVIK